MFGACPAHLGVAASPNPVTSPSFPLCSPVTSSRPPALRHSLLLGSEPTCPMRVCFQQSRILIGTSKTKFSNAACDLMAIERWGSNRLLPQNLSSRRKALWARGPISFYLTQSSFILLIRGTESISSLIEYTYI